MNSTKALPCLCAAAVAISAWSGTAQAQTAFPSAKSLKISEKDRATITKKLTQLEKSVAQLKANKSIDRALIADVEIFAKAAEWILRHGEFFRKNYARLTINALNSGQNRAKELAEGKSPWTHRTGTSIRGYYSKVDGSVQPYALTLPAGVDPKSGARWPLHVKLHGRGSTLNEVSFIGRHEGKALPKGQNWVQLDVFGRVNNAYRFSGETDVFEAMADLNRTVRIDGKRITLHGFSMGGAGAWHLGLHYPSKWSSVGPGAGFVDFYKYQKQTKKRPPHQHAVLGIYDAIDYALNAYNVPVCTYGGELDKQLAASTEVVAAAKKQGVDIKLIIGKGAGHKFTPEGFRKFMDFHLAKSKQGRAPFPGRDSIRFTTKTLKYNECEWLTIEEMLELYKPAIVEGGIDKNGVLKLKTKNVAVLQIARDVADRIEIDGTLLRLRNEADGLLPGVYYEKGRNSWYALNYNDSKKFTENPDLRKRKNLQGPIDDAFMQPFVCVRGTGTAWSSPHTEWANWTLKRFDREFDKWLRGKITIVDDKSVTAEQIADKNLILFGDPGSNTMIAKVLEKLPVKWTKDAIEVGGKKYDPATHGISLIYPNPLNPRRYVVINSGHTFHERDFRASNSWLFPRLGDIAVQKFEKNPKNFAADVSRAGRATHRCRGFRLPGAKSPSCQFVKDCSMLTLQTMNALPRNTFAFVGVFALLMHIPQTSVLARSNQPAKTDSAPIRDARYFDETRAITLFAFDNVSIPFSRNLKLKMRSPKRHPANPVLSHGKPGTPDSWAVQFYGSVIREKGRFRMWYVAAGDDRLDPKTPRSQPWRVAYAESKDGVHWTKPNLGLVEYNGNRNNNLVLMEPHIGTLNVKVLFEPDETNPDRRYKMGAHVWFPKNKVRLGTLAPYASKDGLRWKLLTKSKPVNAEMPLKDTVIPPLHFEPVGGLYKWDGLYYLSGQNAIPAARPYHGRVVREYVSPDFVNWSQSSAVGFVRTAQHKLLGPGRSREGEQNHEAISADPGVQGPSPDPVSDRDAGRVALDNTVGVAGTNNPAFGPLIHLDGVFGDHQGWDGNLFQVETFIPMHLDPGRNLFFLSLNGLANEDGNGMGNFGAGYRVYSPTLNRVFTIAGWIDIDDGHSKTYYRGGVTIESLSDNFDFMMNGYSIIAEDSNVVATGAAGVPIFVGNNVLVSRFRTTEHAYSGGDVSVGGPVPFVGQLGTRIYGGAHYLTSPGRKDAVGGDLRVHQRVSDDLTVDLVYSWDNVFKSNAFVNVGLTLPTGKRNGWMKRWMRQRPTRERLADRIYRNRRIPTSTKTELLAPSLALNPSDGTPITIFYVNDTGAAGGTGTVESPAPSFAPFEGLSVAARNSFDIVLVNGGAFTTNGTLQVGPGQRLLSTAIAQTVSTNLGTLSLPGTSTGVFPVITNGMGGNVLGLSSGSEISGFIVDGGGTGRPIVGTGISGFNVNNNTLRNSFDHGMVLTNALGTVAGGNPGIVTMNTFTGNPSDGMQIINNAVGGGTLDLLLTMNTASNNGPMVGGTGIRIEAHNGNVINADPSVVAGTALMGNTATGNGTGIKLVTTTLGVINASIDGNTITGNTDVNTGLSLNSDGAGSSIVISSMTNNSITGNNGYGINGAATGGGSIVINSMSGNFVTGNTVGNMRLSATGAGSTINANIGSAVSQSNNFSGSTTGAGIELVSTNGNMFVAIRNNIISTAASPNSTFGILGTIDGGIASITVGGGGTNEGNSIVSNNTGMNSGIAMVFSNTAGTPFTPQLNTGGNLISQIGGAGLSVTNQSSNTKLTFTSTNDMILDSATSGLVVANNAALITGEVAVFVDGGMFNDSDAGDGIRLIANNAGTLSANISNILADNNGSFGSSGNGLRFDINNTATANLNVFNSTFSGNDHNVAAATRTNGDGIQININRFDAQAATLNSAVIGAPGMQNVFSNNDGDGLEINHNSTGTITSLVVSGNSSTGNGQRGFFYDSQMTAATATPITATFSNNIVQTNSEAGFSADIRGFFGTRAAPGVINITNNNNFSFNGQEGIRIVTDTDTVRATQVGVNAVTFNHGGGAVIPHDPNDAAFAAQLPAGTFTPAPRGRYLSTLTDINLAVTVTNNQIISNGQAGIAANDDGMSTLVGTDTYVRLDFQNNRAESNAGADFRAGSILSGGATPTTTINAGIDTLTLDGTAQFDLRFLGNRLNTIDVGSTNAFQTNADQGKNFVAPNPWTFAGDAFNNRPVFFYRVDQSGSLNSTNVIISGGVPTNVSGAFTTGRFNLDPGMVFGSAGFATDQPLP
eukprot:g12610.t1